jgi:hypothetical protein
VLLHLLAVTLRVTEIGKFMDEIDLTITLAQLEPSS